MPTLRSASNVSPPAEPAIFVQRHLRIRHLLTVTAVAAFLVVLAQNAFPKANFEGDAPWLEILGFLTIYMLLTCLICLLSLAAVFDGNRRKLNFIFLPVVVAIGSVVASLVLSGSSHSFQNNLGDTIFNSIVYSASMAIGLVAVLAAFYACLLYTSPSPRDRTRSRMPSSA